MAPPLTAPRDAMADDVLTCFRAWALRRRDSDIYDDNKHYDVGDDVKYVQGEDEDQDDEDKYDGVQMKDRRVHSSDASAR